MKNTEELSENEEIRFRCRSPIFMCFTCTRAKSCPDLIQLLKIYKIEEIDNENLNNKFPFNLIEKESKDNRNKLNELTSGEWIILTKTLTKNYTDKAVGYKIHKSHPHYRGIYIWGELITFFTKRGESLLDPCAGTGSSLLSASLLGREAIGFEIDKPWVEKYYDLCKSENIRPQIFANGDCFELIKLIPKNSVDFVIFDPPHLGEFLGKKAESIEITLKSLMANEKENNIDIEIYLCQLSALLRQINRILKSGKYFAMFTKNFYYEKEYKIFSQDVASIAKKEGFLLKGEKVWHQRRERIKPYGYPHSYVPNVIHYNILIFKKES